MVWAATELLAVMARLTRAQMTRLNSLALVRFDVVSPARRVMSPSGATPERLLGM